MGETLTILQVIGSFGGGGAERAAYNVASGLTSLGQRAIGVAVRRPGKYAEMNPAGIPIVSLDAGDGGFFHDLRALWRMRRLLRREKVDVVHIHGNRCLPFCALAMLGMRRKPRVWFTWHTPESHPRGLKRLALLWSLNRCTAFSAASGELVERLRIASDGAVRASVFRLGVPDCQPVDAGTSDVPTLLWLARFVPTKDPQALIRAAAVLKNEGLRFKVILGGGAEAIFDWFRDECHALAEKLGVSDIVSMPGWVDDIYPLLRQSHIGVQTSHMEGLSLTLQEQMMAGLAVVATDVGDTREAVKNEQTGMLIRAKDDAALVASLRRLITDRNLRRALGQKAREHALAERSVRKSGEEALKEYRRLGVGEQALVLAPSVGLAVKEPT